MRTPTVAPQTQSLESIVVILQEELAATNREVLLLTLELEDRVAERTVQLSEANAALIIRATQLEDARAEMDRANLAKNRFVANMSHELRTPLNGIIGFAEFMVDGKPGPLNPKQREYLGDILNSGRHLLQLINDVLDLAKVEAGRTEFYPERFSVPDAIAEVCAVVKPMGQRKRIQVSVEVEASLNSVLLDQQKFKQVLYNLLSNAIKFAYADGQVSVVAKPDGCGRFEVSVKDTGIGIKPEDLRRLFHEFEQLESDASRRYEGTGLGLALTKKLVELQGGSITVDSEVGVGSTFTVVLPLAATSVKS
jgi:signal transduction histidine kinase